MLNIMQTKPLRNYGIDVTQTSFKPLMEELGLEKSVNELTQAEKEILRYISTLNQAKNAMGDFANTIESPANQLKVLKQQFYEMQAAIGNLFVGAFARILPYVNAIIMVIKEVAKTIASLFGIEIKDYNSGLAYYEETLEDYSDALGGVGGSADDAADSIKALKRQTLGFDQINNLVSPTPTSGGGGGSAGAGAGILGAIDDKLLAAIKGYDNGMDKVRMKATEIRDKMMDILGFTKHIDAETGKTYFTYDGWKETVKGIWGWFKELNPLAKIFATLGVGAAFLTIYNAIKKILSVTGILPMFKGLLTVSKNLLTPLKNLGVSMLSFSKTALQSTGGIKNLGEGLKLGIQSWREQEGIIKKGTDTLNGFKGVVAGTKNVLLGLGEAVIGVKTLGDSVDDLTANGANLANVLGTVGGSISTVFGGVQAGAVFGPWGAAIGGVAGAIVALGTAILNTNDDFDISVKKANELIEKNNDYFESLTEVRTESKRLLDESVGMSLYHEKLLDELKQITDENGNVKNGFEERAQFIVSTLAEAYDLQIYYEDGVIKKYQEEIDKIDDLITANKTRIKFSKLSEIVQENYAKEDTTLQKLNDTIMALQTSEENLVEIKKTANDAIKDENVGMIESIKIHKQRSDAQDSYNEALKTTKAAFEEYFEILLDNNQYERAYVANTQNNYDEVTKIMEESRDESIEILKDTMIKNAQTVGIHGKGVLEEWQALANGSREDYKDAISKLPEDVAGEIQIMTGEIVRLTPEVIAYFSMLGSNSEEELMLKLGELPDDLQKEVIDKLKEKGMKIPEEIQKGIDSKDKPKQDIEVSTKDEVQKKVNNSLSGVGGSVDVGINLPSSYTMSERLKNLLSGTSTPSFSLRANANGGVFANGRWQPIQGYANGGIPSGGQLFMAREAGPELVGKIGRHTAVMNNNQIVDSVKAGVYEAVTAAMSNSGMGSVQIDLHTDEGVVVDRINRITRQTGTCPIDI